jgi:hypothetical protein
MVKIVEAMFQSNLVGDVGQYIASEQKRSVV